MDLRTRNENYIKEFSNIQVNGTPLDESVFSTPTVLIPNMYKNDESVGVQGVQTR